jgi:hypothetical protein
MPYVLAFLAWLVLGTAIASVIGHCIDKGNTE